MVHHVLKTHPAMFRAVRDGRKNFDVRKDDRAFQAGDTVDLIFHDPDHPPSLHPAPWLDDEETKTLHRAITFVLRGGQYGVEPGFVVLALSETVTITVSE